MKKGIANSAFLLIGGVIGIVGTGKILGKKVRQEQEMSDKHLSLFLMMNQWVKVKQDEGKIADFFEQNGYHRIAVYGMSYVGKSLVDELENSSIEVVYGIDQNVDITYKNLSIVSLEDKLENVDAVIVTSIAFYAEIEACLNKKISCPIISLEDILYQI